MSTDTVDSSQSQPVSDIPSANPSQTTPETPPAPESPKIDVGALVQKAKESLAAEIAGRETHVTLAEKRLTFRKWGLRNQLAIGGKVLAMVQRITELIPKGELGNFDPSIMTRILSFISDDVIDIIASSMSNSFPTHKEAVEWLDENCNLDNVFDIGILIYSQNFKEGDLGKMIGGLENVTARIQSLSKPSSKN